MLSQFTGFSSGRSLRVRTRWWLEINSDQDCWDAAREQLGPELKSKDWSWKLEIRMEIRMDIRVDIRVELRVGNSRWSSVRDRTGRKAFCLKTDEWGRKTKSTKSSSLFTPRLVRFYQGSCLSGLRAYRGSWLSGSWLSVHLSATMHLARSAFTRPRQLLAQSRRAREWENVIVVVVERTRLWLMREERTIKIYDDKLW